MKPETEWPRCDLDSLMFQTGAGIILSRWLQEAADAVEGATLELDPDRNPLTDGEKFILHAYDRRVEVEVKVDLFHPPHQPPSNGNGGGL